MIKTVSVWYLILAWNTGVPPQLWGPFATETDCDNIVAKFSNQVYFRQIYEPCIEVTIPVVSPVLQLPRENKAIEEPEQGEIDFTRLLEELNLRRNQ